MFGSEAPLIVTASDMTKSTRAKQSSASAHNISESFIRRLPENINKAVFGYTETRNGVPSFTVICLDEGTNTLIAIGGELDTKYEGHPVNRCRSIFEISSPEFFLQKENKRLVTINKKEAKNILEKARIQSPALQNILDSMATVPQTESESQDNYSYDDEIEISTEVVDAYSGQTDMVIYAKDKDGNVAGYLSFSEYGNEPSIKMIEVLPQYRRKGIATRLLQNLQKMYPGVEINTGMTTPDGTALVNKAFYETTDEDATGRLEELKNTRKQLEDVENMLNELSDKRELSADELTRVDELGSEWDRLYSEYRRLQNETEGIRPTKKLVKLDAEDSYSVEPVTYDDDGNVIPLSRRFDEGEEDIRYSVDEETGESGTAGDRLPYEEVQRRAGVKKRAGSMSITKLNQWLLRADAAIGTYENSGELSRDAQEELTRLRTDREYYQAALNKKQERADREKTARKNDVYTEFGILPTTPHSLLLGLVFCSTPTIDIEPKKVRTNKERWYSFGLPSFFAAIVEKYAFFVPSGGGIKKFNLLVVLT